ncbi:MAG: hypothetical protein K8R58_03315 [Bacteroidales bacterium]|nr:hypothetical protein [Bacteroidales bacterium]
MKLFYLNILLSVLSLNLFSQIHTDTIFSCEWNEINHKWETFDRIITKYNNDIKISELVQLKERNTWNNYYLTVFNYNLNNQITEEFEQYWDEYDNKWVDNYKLTYIFNYNGKLDTLVHKNIFNKNSIDASREIMIYHSNGKVKEKIVQQYYNSWKNFIRYQYCYNMDNVLLEEKMSYWNVDDWDNSYYKWIYKYNTNGQLIEKIKKQNYGSYFIDNSKDEYNYDENGYLNEYSLKIWIPWNNIWENSNKIQYTNDANGNVLKTLNQNWENNKWKNNFQSKYSTNSNFIPDKNFINGKTFTIYPNPFKNSAKIEFENPNRELYLVRIMDKDGKLVNLCKTYEDFIIIERNDLKRGIYFIELQGSSFYSGKFIIE